MYHIDGLILHFSDHKMQKQQQNINCGGVFKSLGFWAEYNYKNHKVINPQMYPVLHEKKTKLNK